MGINDLLGKKPEQENNEEPVKKTNIIDQETAEFEFDRFCEGWEIDTEESEMSEEDLKGFQDQKRKFVKAVQKGRLSYNDDDNSLLYKFSEKSKDHVGKEIKMRIPKGDAYLSMDRYREQQGMHKVYGMLGAMTNHDPKYYSSVSAIDLKPLQAIFLLFLAD